MTNTAILILIGVVAIAAIFLLVFYSGRRGEMHRQKTTIKPESRRQNKVG
ncbi:MAG TPA: hypothetical protein VFD62_02200 [Pyrinomonadaceae bacterium]|nr:hypothetical protein [Pyrinomonadaceae bacterium]